MTHATRTTPRLHPGPLPGRWVLLTFALLTSVGLATTACNKEKEEPEEPKEQKLQTVALHAGAAFMGVHGTDSDDVWAVGADDGTGPLVLHFDGEEFSRMDTGVRGDLWWVHALSKNEAYFSGSDSHLLRYDGEKFERLAAPGLGKHTLFGVWVAGSDDVYAVGAVAGRNGFIWHFDGDEFTDIPLPDELIKEDGDLPPLFKVAGRSAEDVWVVGEGGTVLRGNKDKGFSVIPSGTSDRLFTIHVSQDEVLAVGGASEGIALSASLGESNDDDVQLVEVTPQGAPLLQGAIVGPSDFDWVSGRNGEIYQREDGEFERFQPEVVVDVQSFHALWAEPGGALWAAGGNVISGTLDGGVLVRSGAPLPVWEAPVPDPTVEPACPEDQVDPAPDGSMARRWNEQLLGAVRRDVPRPTVHARNLLHTSIAMWDAWAAYDDAALGVLYLEKESASNLESAREEAIAYASYRVLSHRYNSAVGGGVSQACFDAFMEELGFDAEELSEEGDSPAALGNRIGAQIIAEFADDGANEENNYADPEGFKGPPPVLIVDHSGTETETPTVWQQLLLAQAETQNGIDQGAGVRDYVGAHWGAVRPFALERSDQDSPYFTMVNPPLVLDDELVAAAVEVVAKTAALDIDDGEMIDISPGAYGNNTLGANDGTGHPENPVTGSPYEPERVLRGDFTRILAEFWADGPASETPPGHWNSLANQVADHPEHSRRLFGEGEELDSLSWDVHVYLALNGALHDAAIAAWELKRTYTTARPITLVRYLSGKGQSSDPDGPSYDAEGMPLVPNLIEVITEESAAPGERHAHLARYVGDIAVRSWRGEPGDRTSEVGGVDWIRGVDWIPYQRRTFVTPEFPGYVSGHSTFSRAGAEVLTAVTGSAFFPGGLGKFVAEPGYLFFEYGPSASVELQWATYYDAADQAGQSRIFGGIHVHQDDFDGRTIGSSIGQQALTHAQTFFAP